MGIILWMVLGAIAGSLASLIMKVKYKYGWLTDILLGIFGSSIGGWIMNSAGWPGVVGFNMYSVLVSTLGAIVLIAIGRLITTYSN